MVTRYPVQIGNWKVNESKYNIQELSSLIEQAIKNTLIVSKNPGILLSGGVDSSILVLLIKKFYPNIPCFTIGSSFNHPDIIAAVRLAKEFDLKLFIYLPSKKDIELARKKTEYPDYPNYPGDEIVYLALQFASHFVTDILATDGIDEQMGGYWWHIHRKDNSVFKCFWDKIEDNHLTPMFRSAKQLNVNLHWIYLYPKIVDYISRIPFDDRAKDGVGKVIWKQLAQFIGVPQWVIDREKKGFVDALE